MKLYLLTGRKGDWDDTVHFQIGFYSSRELAEEAWEEYKKIAKKVMGEEKSKMPITEEEYEELSYKQDPLSNEDQEKVDKYSYWLYCTRSDVFKIDFQTYWIDEMEMDKTDFSLIYQTDADVINNL